MRVLDKATYPIPIHPTWEVLDSSKMKTYMECPRKYFYNYVLGLTPLGPNPHLVFGESWHRALECIYRLGKTEEAVRAGMKEFLDYYRQFFTEDTDLDYVKNPGAAEEALRRYVTAYPLDNYETLYTEVSGAVPITDNSEIFFRLDTILKDRKTGMIFSHEHKTTSRLSSKWSEQWDLDIQTSTYTHALYCLFPADKVEGIVVNGTVFRKQGIEFIRVPVRKPMIFLDTWLYDMEYYSKLLFHDFEVLSTEKPSSAAMRAFPRNPTSCDMYFGCPYRDICYAWNNPIKDASSMPSGFQREHWDPRDRCHGDHVFIKESDGSAKIIKKEETKNA